MLRGAYVTNLMKGKPKLYTWVGPQSKLTWSNIDILLMRAKDIKSMVALIIRIESRQLQGTCMPSSLTQGTRAMAWYAHTVV